MPLKKLIILVILGALLTTFFTFDLSQYLDFAYLKENQLRFSEYYNRNPMLVSLLFFVIYIS